MTQIFYQQPNARVGDVIPQYVEGTYQLFYLKNWRDRTDPEFVPGWHRMETRDLVQMSREVPVHVMGGTGDLIEKEGVWHLFACIFPNGKQLVTHTIRCECPDVVHMGEEGGKTFPYDVELESAVRTPEDGVYRLEVLTEGSVGVAYVNQQAALSFRMYDHTGGYMGLFSFGKATFSQISWKGKHV